MNRRDFMKVAAGVSVVAGVAATEAVAAPPAPQNLPWFHPDGIQFGLSGLDAITSLAPGDLGLITGYAGSGKSSLMLSAAKETLARDPFAYVVYHDVGYDVRPVADKWDRGVRDHLCCHQIPFELPDGPESARIMYGSYDLLVIDCLGNRRSRTLYEECAALKQLAMFLNIPILAGVQFNRPAVCLGESLNEHDDPRHPSFAWMKPVDLLIRCHGGHGRVLVDGPAINFTVLKNKYGAVGENFTHKLTPLLALSQFPC